MNLGHARKTRLLVPFMGVLEIFRGAPPSLLSGSTPGLFSPPNTREKRTLLTGFSNVSSILTSHCLIRKHAATPQLKFTWVSPSRTLAEAALLHLFPVILNVNNRLRVVPQLERAKIATSERRIGDACHLPSEWRVSVTRARVFPRSIACSTRSDSKARRKLTRET